MDRCKVYFVMIVSITLCLGFRSLVALGGLGMRVGCDTPVNNGIGVDFRAIGLKGLDIHPCNHIVWITIYFRWTRDEPLKANQRQTPDTTKERLPTPASRIGQQRAVCPTRVLRHTRPGAGQVRDVAWRSSRRSACCRHRARFWFVSAHLLPGTGCLRALRPAWLASREERTATLPQAYRGRYGLRHKGIGGGASTASCRASSAHPTAFRYYRSSAQHPTGARPSQSKKNRVETPAGSSARQADIEDAEWSQLYEQLRGWALHSSVELSSGPRPIGFGVIVRSGICAWLETCSCWTPLIEPKAKRSCDLPKTLSQSVQVQLAMVIAGTLLNKSNQAQGVTR